MNPSNRNPSSVQDKSAEIHYKESLYQMFDLAMLGHSANRTKNSFRKESNNLSQTPHHLIGSFATKIAFKKEFLLMNTEYFKH